MPNLPPPNPPQVLRLTIAKFSHTTTSTDHVGPLNWTHVHGNGDITCTFDKYLDLDSIPSRLIQKVFQGDDLLEQLDLVFFVRMAAMQAQLVPPPKSQFAVVVKSPCLAVKYPHGTNIRRFQIKFTSERDYFTVLTLLGEINCPLTEGKPPAPAVRRFPSVSSWTSGHLSSIPPRTVNTVATSTGSNWVSHPAGAISERTTPIRATSPASTISHAAPKFQPLPAFIVPQNTEPADPFQQLEAPTLTNKEHQGAELASSQLSTISASHEIDQLNKMLPPKRELPFQVPAAKRTRTTSLTRTTQKQKQKHSNPFSKSQPAPQTNDPKLCPLDPVSKRDDIPTFPAHNFKNLSQADSSQPNLSQPNLSQPEAHPDPTPPLILYEEAPVSQALPPRSSLAEQASQAASIQETLQTGQDPVPSIPQLIVRTNDEPPITPEDWLAQYMASPTPERTAFLENWMCELLEDDNFLALCQDVDSVWWRFAFGRRQ
ncbi:uncharacterized protein N7515_005622 [Penicillium bovifimosum]|uniref:Uncharacterized protein n=1 Tax=Penicillium bovifimosum TaxID=126998 RepID=A0A9W9GTF4_9EURO|nr:uncharacterized protein N7515_005622 [Penicillium bovifimosum]KAJ5129583.1 hypothetical protein N7515_005622 [Penicillium bovifimosum]